MPGSTPAASGSVASRAYLFVDGIHVSVRVGEDDPLCLLVVLERARGRRQGGGRR
jgi:hypothetical protein